MKRNKKKSELEKAQEILDTFNRKEKNRAEKKKELGSDWLWGALFIFICQMFILIITYSSNNGTNTYYHGQNTILIMDILVFVGLVFNRDVNSKIEGTIKKLINKEKLITYDIGNLIIILIGIIAIITFFLLDFSFINKYGLKIPTVVVLVLVNVILRKRR